MKMRKKQNKAWNIIPIAAITIFVLALVIRICFPNALKTEKAPSPDVNQGDTTVNLPDTPDQPNVPDTPDIPDTPDVPDTPDTPDTPDVPDTPDTPDTPDIPVPEPEPDPEPTAPGEPYADVWSLILVNPTHYLPEGYEVELETVQSKYKMDSRAAGKAREMIAAAAEDGIDLLVCSAYRSHEKQTSNFNAKLNTYLDKGWDYDEAYKKTATIIAVPGTSEHETGLALDIVTPSYQVLDAGYENTAAAKWLLENAKDYGFILRFPKDKGDITKIIFEPWHYRYVGIEYASLIMDSGLCLEEWLGQVD